MQVHTILNLILRMEKKNYFNFEKCAFSGKGRQSLHIAGIASPSLIGLPSTIDTVAIKY